ncbi:MAG: hypothetical protein V3V15_03320 [Sphingorhabdus sp.]
MRRHSFQILTGAILAASFSPMPLAAQNIAGSKITATSTLGNGTARFPLSQIADGINSDASPFNGFEGPGQQTGVIRLDLDQAYTITRFYLWNDINVRSEGVKTFSLRLYDSQNNLLGNVGPFTTTAGQAAPNVTSWSNGFPGVKRVDLVINSLRTGGGIKRVEIREVAFDGRPAGGYGPPPPPPKPVQTDAFRCYDILRHNGPNLDRFFTMVDQFGKTTTYVGHAVQLCNPAVLNDRQTTPAQMAERYKEHLVCYEILDIHRSRANRENVAISNQLESGTLSTAHEDQICVVSTKRRITPPPPPPPNRRQRN